MTLARIPEGAPRENLSAPTNMIGASPVASENSAMLEEEGAGGLREPAAKMPECASGENARADMIPGLVRPRA